MTIPHIFIIALIFVESGGNPHAIGDNGKALGCLQIHEVLVQDVNRILAIRGSAKRYVGLDRASRVKSVQMLRIYLSHYATRERLGREPTLEDMARIWNGGPNGWRKKSTDKYWAKVRDKLNLDIGLDSSSLGGFVVAVNNR